MSKSINIEYTESKNYTIVPVTGVIGSISPQGLVQCELYAEKANVAKNYELKITESGAPIEPQSIHVTEFTRELQSSLLITPEIARSIGEWLIQKADEALIRNPSTGNE